MGIKSKTTTLQPNSRISEMITEEMDKVMCDFPVW